MEKLHFQAHKDQVQAFLREVLDRYSQKKAQAWYQAKADTLKGQSPKPQFYMSFSGAVRFQEDRLVSLGPDELTQAQAIRAGFKPQNWTLVHWTRAYFLSLLPSEAAGPYFEVFEKLYDSADMNELIALYSFLPLLDHPHLFIARASEGLRTNMTSVFDAVALDNPYPTEFFEENAWNQMYLKAAFMGRPLYRIPGIDQRANPSLARIISDYAHERWSAGRVVSPEIWRPLSQHLSLDLLPDIEKVLAGPDPHQAQAALLVLQGAALPEARALWDNFSDQNICQQIENKEITWESLGMEWNQKDQ